MVGARKKRMSMTSKIETNKKEEDGKRCWPCRSTSKGEKKNNKKKRLGASGRDGRSHNANDVQWGPSQRSKGDGRRAPGGPRPLARRAPIDTHCEEP